MLTAIIVIFVVGYLFIALEHPLHIDKAATALLTGTLCWTVYALGTGHLLLPEKVPNWFRLQVGYATIEEEAKMQHESHGNGHGDSVKPLPNFAQAAPSQTPATTENGASPEGHETASHDTPHTDISSQAADAVAITNVKADVAHDAHAAGSSHHSPEHLVREYLVDGQLLHSLSEIAGILFFLIGAMTIVELVDAYEGFALITSRITAKSQVKLLWVVCWLTFFMSAVLDNLTTTIVMVSLLKKLIKDVGTRRMFVGMLILAANAGGAWTVIGDVTTTMLWIKGKITTVAVMQTVFLPSIICLLVPLCLVSLTMKGTIETPERSESSMHKNLKPFHQKLFLLLGLLGLLFVPIFKSVTHLPPFMGMLFSLSVIWIAAEIIKHDLDERTRSSTHVLEILKKIDTASILFFLGILLAISSLASTGLLGSLANTLDEVFGTKEIIALIIGLVSAIVDNVPLVAAGIEMYDLKPDSNFWLFLAYCAGTGGSCLIIGSAAGVAAMGLEKIDFIWYTKNISWLALIGYLAGAGVYTLQSYIMTGSMTQDAGDVAITAISYMTSFAGMIM